MPDVGPIVVCGAGVAGVSTAFHLTRLGAGDVVLVDPRPPLTLTSDKSTECYRNWWPSQAMVALMGRSIDLLEQYAVESGNAFGLNRRGYLFVTADEAELARMAESAAAIAALGAGDLRVHEAAVGGYVPSPPDGFAGVPDGADLLVGPRAVLAAFPDLSPRVAGALHVRRAGWLSAQQLGAWMLDGFTAAGGRFVRGEITRVEMDGDRVRTVIVGEEDRLPVAAFVNAAGPMLGGVASLVGVRLPVHSEVHQKLSFRDHRAAFPREAPLLIWSDEQAIDWSDEERSGLAAMGRPELLGMLPRFCHGRPEGGADSSWALGLWEWRRDVREPEWPLPEDPLYPELVVRGLAAMIPAMGAYRDALPPGLVDGGYYTKTNANRPLSGPAGPEGSFVSGALSGFGVMASCAVGELTARHVLAAELPHYANDFLPEGADQAGADEDAGQL